MSTIVENYISNIFKWLSAEPTTRLYKNQRQYIGGQLACTSICWHWGIACLLKIIAHPICLPQEMDVIMKQGVKVHEYLCNKLSESMLSSHEMVQAGCPKPLKTEEIHLNHTQDMIIDGIPHVRDFEIQAQTAFIHTVNNHTTAYYRDANKTIFYFDPMRAEVTAMPSISQNLLQYQNVSESYGILLSFKE